MAKCWEEAGVKETLSERFWDEVLSPPAGCVLSINCDRRLKLGTVTMAESGDKGHGKEWEDTHCQH